MNKRKHPEEGEEKGKKERTKSLLFLAKRPGKGKAYFPPHNQQQQWAQSC